MPCRPSTFSGLPCTRLVLGILALVALGRGALAAQFATLLGASALLLILMVRDLGARGAGWSISVGISVLILAAADVGAAPLARQIVQERTASYDPASDYVSSDYWVEDDVVGYLARPGVHGSRRTVAADGSVIYDVTYSIGADGFRVTPTVSTGPERVTLLGGSFAFGEGLDDDETVAYYLSKDLGVAVKNLGFHGFGMHQALALMQRETGVPGDTVVILTAPWHAPRSSCIPSYTHGTPRFVLMDGIVVRSGDCEYLESGGGYSQRLLDSSGLMSLMRARRPSVGAIAANDIELYLAIIEEIANLAAREDQRVVVGFIRASAAELSKSGWSNEEILSELRDIADSVVDVTLGIDPDGLGADLFLHELDRHPSSEANRRRASLIAPEIS